MSQPADCTICRRILPMGGVLDDVGRPVHYVCGQLAKRQIADDAQITARRVAKEGRPTSRQRPLTAERQTRLHTTA
jgi:hypothetical protein